MLAGYLGKGGVIDEAIARFAAAYADQTERDHAALAAAARQAGFRSRPSSESLGTADFFLGECDCWTSV
jgi:Uncharacterized protein conserved in bacteria (DUF2252)